MPASVVSCDVVDGAPDGAGVSCERADGRMPVFARSRASAVSATVLLERRPRPAPTWRRPCTGCLVPVVAASASTPMVAAASPARGGAQPPRRSRCRGSSACRWVHDLAVQRAVAGGGRATMPFSSVTSALARTIAPGPFPAGRRSRRRSRHKRPSRQRSARRGQPGDLDRVAGEDGMPASPRRASPRPGRRRRRPPRHGARMHGPHGVDPGPWSLTYLMRSR